MEKDNKSVSSVHGETTEPQTSLSLTKAHAAQAALAVSARTRQSCVRAIWGLVGAPCCEAHLWGSLGTALQRPGLAGAAAQLRWLCFCSLSRGPRPQETFWNQTAGKCPPVVPALAFYPSRVIIT